MNLLHFLLLLIALIAEVMIVYPVDKGVLCIPYRRDTTVLRWFTPDYHTGTVLDIISRMKQMNYPIYISNRGCNRFIPSWYGSVHYCNETEQRNAFCVSVGRQPYCQYHPYGTHELVANKLFYLYKNDTLFMESDAIVCMFWPTICRNYMAFNKVMVYIVGHRFYLPECNKDRAEKIIDWYKKAGNGVTETNNLLVYAASVYDKEYINYYTCLDVPIVYAQSSLTIQPIVAYKPTIDAFLVAPFRFRTNPYKANFTDSMAKLGLNYTFTTIKEVSKGPFSFDVLRGFRGVVVFPYAVMSYYINDLQATAIPMFVPSPSFLVKLGIMYDYRVSDNIKYYCHGKGERPDKCNSTRHHYDPESDDEDSKLYWFKYASFYTPGVVQFDSFDDLMTKVRDADYQEMVRSNNEYLEFIKKSNDKRWKEIKAVVKRNRNRTVPATYGDALRLLNTTFIINKVDKRLLH